MTSSRRALDAQTQNTLALHFASLHKPGSPILLANVYDGATAKAIISHSGAKAVATASYAIGEAQGITDDDLTLEQNLQSIRIVASVVVPSGKPLTVDLQDGYDDVAKTIKEAIFLGAVGCNIEDVDREASPRPRLRDAKEAIKRLQQAKQAAEEVGVPDFVVNARTDALLFGASIEDAIDRGQAYLDAGATTAFIWGGPKRGVSTQEVKQLVSGLGGMVNVKMNLRPGFLDVSALRELGVARISVGPELFHRAMKGYREGADLVLGS